MDKEQPVAEEEVMEEEIIESVDEQEAVEDDATPSPDVDSAEEVDELERLRQEVQMNMDRWQRSVAEFQNYKKRTDRELTERYQHAVQDTLKDLLPIVDDFERAFENIPDDIQDHPWMSGVSMIQRKFDKLLEQHEIESVDPTGELFDPNLHEAVGTDDSDDVESGYVTVTLQKGFKRGDKVLRPALVRVAN